jgi:putative ABC transport system substrate-binding protein
MWSLGAGETMRRREFIACVGGAAVAWSLAARAQQPALPVVGVVSGRSRDADARNVSAFYKGLGEAGFVDGQNVTVEYHWVEGHYDRLPEVMADLVRRQVAVIATTGNNRPLWPRKLQPRQSRSSSPLAKTR